ncbi:DUF6089 family protein [Chondrinema litorale]|uniref:DUF6089 family protein n=1 Tax=Chondrinema litorale TaxID=2994555 RepID=UPI002542C30E|nr:DUF6089 family protein [Chondrinema litorale]UZR94955.1 DUF6089 family protein [Chondrinema litorale]
MKFSVYPLLVLVFLLAFSELSFGQRGRYSGKFTKKKRYWSVGLSTNTINYFGDIVPKNTLTSFDIEFTRPQIGLFVQRRIFPSVTIRLNAAWGRIAGSDYASADPEDEETGGYYRYRRNLHFRNTLYELSSVVIYDLIKNPSLSYRRPEKPIPYILAGLGIFYHNPQAMRPEGFSGTEWVDLRPLKTENQLTPYSPIGLAIPVGLGVRYRVSRKVDVAFEMGYRFTFTDYLDDVSGNYVDPAEFRDDLARALHDRSAETTDMYTGGTRDAEVLGEVVDYVSPIDGKTYRSINGFGMPNNYRGSPDKDVYLVTGFQVSYIFSTTRTPKFR